MAEPCRATQEAACTSFPAWWALGQPLPCPCHSPVSGVLPWWMAPPRPAPWPGCSLVLLIPPRPVSSAAVGWPVFLLPVWGHPTPALMPSMGVLSQLSFGCLPRVVPASCSAPIAPGGQGTTPCNCPGDGGELAQAPLCRSLTPVHRVLFEVATHTSHWLRRLRGHWAWSTPWTLEARAGAEARALAGPGGATYLPA